MVDNQHPVEPNKGGVRRRRSTQIDDNDLPLPRPISEPISPTAASPATSTLQRAAASTISLTSAIMAPSLNTNIPPIGPRRSSSRTRPISATESARTVRFSAEIDAATIPSDLRAPLSTQSPRQSLRNSRGPQGLTVRVPENEVVEIEPRSPRGSIKSILRSPQSPTTRSRGYSLRSNLFRRNIETGGTVIEMEETPNTPGSSSSPGFSINSDVKGSSQKSPGTIVSVEQIESENYGSGSGKSSDTKSGKKGTASVLPNYYSAWAQNRKREGKFSHTIKRIKKQLEKTILRIQDVPPTKDGRHITVDASRKKPLIDERTQKTYCENWIRSTRYTVHTFLPRQLVAQFSKLANFYFLCVAILQMIPGFSTTGKATTLAPLLFFVAISMGKEAYDDLRRYKLDKEENAKEATVLHAYLPTDGTSDFADNSGSLGLIHWASIKWAKLKVGDIIKLKRDEAIPADVLLLHVEGGNHIAYVETMALDGETNLKSKITPQIVGSACATEDKLATCRAEFVVEDPNPNLYAFEGRVTVDGQTLPLSNTEIIYRGSILRNTPEAIAMVIYTGEECKIRMNANKNPRTKAPKLQFLLNRIVAIVVVFVLCLALFNSLAHLIWRRKKERRLWYLTVHKQTPFAKVLSPFFIMFSTMIPLSLYVSMEIIKLAQMFLLSDIDMYDEKSNTPFEARTSTINEELGQVTHIFSDKTGTLTDNEMRFRKMSVAGTVWLHDVDLQGEDKAIMTQKKRSKGKKPAHGRKSFMSDRRKSFATSEHRSSFAAADDDLEGVRPSGEGARWQSSARPAKSQPERSTMELVQYLRRRPDTAFATRTRLLLLSIALCHTCLPERKEDGSINFQASSPDELALVIAAQELGYLMINREHGLVTLRIQPSTADATSQPIEEVYEILNVIEFSSERKRMSVVVRFPDGKICVVCKGADNVIMERLRLASLAAQKANEIEAKSNRRKSMEAQVALARRSTQIDIDRNDSVRRSFSLSNPRLSISGSQRNPARQDVDTWLRNRESDVEIVGEEQPDAVSARFSTHLQRMSIATSEGRPSMVMDFDDDLIDEALINDDAAVIERCFQHINEFATEGLRTLLYGYRFMEESEYSEWNKIFHAASTSLSERDEKVQKAGAMIEYDFDLAGATAIEDKLQVGVPETIDRLRRANISMWMLTGDKRETAINIGHSCRLIKDYSVVIVLDNNIGEVEQHIAAGIMSLQTDHIAHSVVVVDGMTLSTIMQYPHVEHLFMDLAVMVDSVICCRAQPSQKALLVKAIRKRIKSSVTLAIGDGSNDIAMIQEAHVGIGISGKEGLQAARTSDYSIAQFRFLAKLLLVHGRWNYIRTCKYILGTLWKEILFFLTQAVYQRYCGYSATSLYEPWSLATFNTLFTSLPVLVMGIFEKDLAASTLIAVPELYRKGQRNGAFNIYIYAGWMAMGAAESLLTIFLMLILYARVISTLDTSLFSMGDLTFVAVVLVINMKMQLIEQHNLSIMAWGSLFLSLGAIFLWNIILGALYPHHVTLYHVRGGWFNGFGRNPNWWLALILIVAIIAVFEYGVIVVRKCIAPTDADVFQELEKDPAIKKRFEEASAMELSQGWNAAAEADREEEGIDEEGEVRPAWKGGKRRRRFGKGWIY